MEPKRSNFSLQPWLYSPRVDSLFILAPAFLVVAGVLALQEQAALVRDMPLWVWVVFILCIDVAHVYATLFRTYLHKEEFQKDRVLYTVVPVLAWLGGAIVYSLDDLMFWRVLAYIAVFHFIRQQYGFMMLYARKEENSKDNPKWLDRALIYSCTLYPIIYWHAHLPRNFHWFVESDFIAGLPEGVDTIAFPVYLGIVFLYALKEIRMAVTRRRLNLPKNLFALGTALSWYVGIVAFDGDIIFSVINVVGHGIPYMALIWIYGRKQTDRDPTQITLTRFNFSRLFQARWIPVYLAMLIGLAVIEEGFWNGLVWREHLEFFRWFAALPKIEDKATLAWVISLLSLPQVTHYILDGFIWKLREDKAAWKNTMFQLQR